VAVQELVKQTQLQQEALHALEARMEAIEAQQRHSWTQWLWRRRAEPEMMPHSVGGPSRVIEDPVVAAGVVDRIQEKPRPRRSWPTIESLQNIFYEWSENPE
jgi:hypothetical protein